MTDCEPKKSPPLAPERELSDLEKTLPKFDLDRKVESMRVFSDPPRRLAWIMGSTWARKYFEATAQLKDTPESLQTDARKDSVFDKVDRALEMQVIDWLQYAEFPESLAKNPDDSDMARLALELIDKRKQMMKDLESQVEKYREALREISKEWSPYGHDEIAKEALK